MVKLGYRLSAIDHRLSVVGPFRWAGALATGYEHPLSGPMTDSRRPTADSR
jgi:hypothetical protein